MQHLLAEQAGATVDSANNEAPAVAAAWGPEDRSENAGLDSRNWSDVEQADRDFATQRARLALRGFELYILSGPDGRAPEYRVCRWNLSRTLPDMAAVTAFADQVGGRGHA